ncbi:MAG: ATP-binding protein [Lachnospiraceae bacterium]|nr:ATP-binding protein [Lachnospiraceae bacterium]
MEEGQIFDRKSIAIHATALSDVVCTFANADGGTIAIGISDKTRTIEGVDYENDKLNDLLRVPIDYCNPSVQVKTEMIPCRDFKGRDNHILLMHIGANTFLHANHANEVFQRIGDKSKKLSFEDRMNPNAKIDARNLTVKEKTDYLNVEKMSIDTLKNRIKIKGYQQPTEEKLLRIYAVMETNRVFSIQDVMKELSCPDSTARSIMKKLRDLDVIVSVKGMGKGKYRFK